MRVLIATSIGPGKEYCRQILPNVLRGIARACSVPVAFLIVFDGVAPSEILEGASALALAEPAGDLTIDGRLARMREAQRQFFLLRRSFSHLYWHDADMIPPIDIIDRLMALDRPIASGLYNLRGDREGVLALRLAGEEAGSPDRSPSPRKRGRPRKTPESAPRPDLPGTVEVQTIDGQFEASATGMGCLLVRRCALEATPFRDPSSYRDRAWGEDIRWCLDTGHRVLVDATLPCWHIDERGNGTRPVLTPRTTEN